MQRGPALGAMFALLFEAIAALVVAILYEIGGKMALLIVLGTPTAAAVVLVGIGYLVRLPFAKRSL